MNNATTSKRTRKTSKKFAPAAWQWDASQLVDLPDYRIQAWTAGGACSLVSLETARKMVQSGAYFLGSTVHICQVHDGIDGVNAK